MLATEHAQGPSVRNFMASSSMHARAHMNAIPTSYAPNMNSSQANKHPTGSSKRSMNGGQQAFSPPTSNPPSQPPPNNNGAPQIDGNNIMNRKADLNSSLYQICLGLRKRLSEVPGFDQHIVEMEDEEAEADDSTDPVTSMWNCLRRGYPLMTIYNALQPRVPLEVDPSKVAESKIGKAATFKFLQACLTDLKFPANECFLITDLYGGDTTGFVKVTKVVNRVLDLLSQRGMLLRTDPGPGDGRDSEEPQTRTHRQHVVEELVTSERTYVQHLETLQQFKNQIEQTGAIPGDAVHDIFLNLNALLDFQRRFLIRIEQQNSLPESHQNWGRLFIQYKDSFRVYEPFIANQTRCNATVEKEWDKLKAAEVSLSPEVRGMVASSNVLNAFLLKPFQRLSKYPMLLLDLRKNGGLDAERQNDLLEGEAAASSVLVRANDAVDKEQRLQAVGELQSRVEDWKGHKIEHFGELLLYGDFTVLKGDGVREVEREVRIIFDALDPECRALIRQAMAHIPPLLHLPQPSSGLDVIPKEPADEEDPTASLTRVTEKKLGKPPQAPKKLRGLHKSPMSSFFSRLKGTPLPKTDSPKMSGTPQSLVGTYSESQITRLCSREGSGSDGGSAPPTPSRRGKSDDSGALTKFGHKFKHKFKRSRFEHTTQMLQPFQLEALAAAHSSFHFSFNGPLRHDNILMNFQRPELEGDSAVDKAVLQGEYADERELGALVSMQYKVYLFERILLCCKEINPNKQKNKMLGNNKSILDKKGKPRLQLKGRIFMQNVTDVMSLSKIGTSHSIQIFWRGDPGVENFVIRFGNEDMMIRWRTQVEVQKKALNDSARSSGQTGTSETEFTYLRGQGATLQNPYQQDEDADEEHEEAGPHAAMALGGQSEFIMSRNASSTSLRSRSTTGSSGPPMSQLPGRVPPPRFPLPENAHGPPLTLHTNLPASSMSPAELAASSYFSPAVESPISTRSSSQASMYPFPRQGTPASGWTSEESKHNTAPATVRASSRDGQVPLNSYNMNGRTVQRPSLPAIASQTSQSAQQLTVAQNRMRSASSPDIQQVVPGPRRYVNGQVYSATESVPVPPIPAHMAQMRAPVNRSQSNSPTNGQLPFRSASQSPNLQRDGGQRYQGYYGNDGHPQPQAIRHEPRPYLHSAQTPPPPLPTMEHRIMSPPLPSATQGDEIPYPSQLKVKIWFEPNPCHVTIVVPIIIKHRSLIDRIDSKMEKISKASISRGTARLRYKDADGDSVTIASEEDVQLAIEDWGQAHEEELRAGNIADFELLWQEM